LARVCRTWDLHRSTVYFQRHQWVIPLEQLPGPREVFRDEIAATLDDPSDEAVAAEIRDLFDALGQ
jgi:hypothetical protein